MSTRGVHPVRLERCRQIAAHIDRHPGETRSRLAARFSLSERQVQADLQVIAGVLGYPLVRDHGYRIQPDPGTWSDMLALRAQLARLKPEALEAAAERRIVERITRACSCQGTGRVVVLSWNPDFGESQPFEVPCRFCELVRWRAAVTYLIAMEAAS